MYRARFAIAKPPLKQQAAAAPRTQLHLVLLVQVGGHRLADPEIALQTHVAGLSSHRLLQVRQVLGTQFAGSPTANSFLQSRQPVLLETLHPVSNGSRSISQDLGHLATIHAFGHQQHTVQAMVITRLLMAECIATIESGRT